MAYIPIVDFADYGLHVKDTSLVDPTRLRALTDEVKHIFSTVGFCYLKNHGVDEKLVDDFMRVSRNFFELPTDVKTASAMSSEHKSGWVGLGDERLNPDRPADLKESFDYCPSWDIAKWPNVDNLESLNKQMYQTCKDLAYRFLEVLSFALDLPTDFMKNAHTLIGQEHNPTAIRSLYYPPIQDASTIKPGQVRLGEHTDYGTVTLLFQDDIGGLEVSSVDNGFVPATPIPGTVLVNIGSLLQRWTSDFLVATEHRVLVPEEELRRRCCRQSAVFFVLPDDECVVKCLDGSDKYEPIKSIDYLNYRFDQAYLK